MSAADIKPSRYAQALGIANELMTSFPASYITIPFAAIPLERTPRSTDTAWIQQVLGQNSLGSYHINDAYMGSAPGNAIWYAWNALRSYPSKKRTILLLGDGNTNTWYAIDSFIPYLQRDHVQLYICVIGQSGYVLWQNYADQAITTSLDTGHLDGITQATNGQWWMCNTRQGAVSHIIIALSKSAQNENFISTLPMNDLHIIALYCIIYNILIIGVTFCIYAIHRKKTLSPPSTS